MNQSPQESQQADFQTSGHGRNLILVAILLLVVPMIVIGVLSNVSDDEQRLVACRVTIRVNGEPLTSGQVLSGRANALNGEKNSTGTLDTLGQTELTTGGQPGVHIGHHRVAVITDSKTGGIQVPETFQSLKTTTLTMDVQPEPRFNNFTIDVTVDD
ncbi:MAG TPA: hypothetical protein DCE43_05680 [Planctomycetaceae bacterium]|nr:hypothetical protein [Planctomycetaceae bacterium]HCK52961.1 hypothetical protein [Planctomycetaceae bacterium]|tara:strand:- start:2000 stop:2470 length:471 start_codon:yes stop_codon:yes gene_type:complete